MRSWRASLAHGRYDDVLVSQGTDRDVMRERVPRHSRNGLWRLITYANGGRTGGCETAREERHLGRVARGDHEHIHGGQPSSTRTPVARSLIASVTTTVSRRRTTMYPSPS
jgi:hypothetical protein